MESSNFDASAFSVTFSRERVFDKSEREEERGEKRPFHQYSVRKSDTTYVKGLSRALLHKINVLCSGALQKKKTNNVPFSLWENSVKTGPFAHVLPGLVSCTCHQAYAPVSIHQHTTAYVSIRQHARGPFVSFTCHYMSAASKACQQSKL